MKRKIAIRIFNCFLKIYGAEPKPKHKHRNLYKFLDHWNQISVKEHNNMHSLDQACTDNLSLPANISDFAIFPFWKWLYGINGFKCFGFIASHYPQSFLFTRNKLLKKPLLYCISFLLTSSSTFPSLQSPSVFVFLFLSSSCYYNVWNFVWREKPFYQWVNIFLHPFKLTFGIEFIMKKILLEDYLEMNLTELD